MGVIHQETDEIIKDDYKNLKKHDESNSISVKRWVILGGMFCLLNICFIIVICLSHSLRAGDVEVISIQGAETGKVESDSTLEDGLIENGSEDISSEDGLELDVSDKETADKKLDEGIKDSSNLISDDDDKRKRVYLTFDDGPTKNTEKILDILQEYNVQATFFVIGRDDAYSKSLYQRIVEEGHTLAMHSYSHNYSEIYQSKKAFYKDFDKIYNLLFETTGVEPKYYRFPGGTSNQVSKVSMKSLAKSLTKRGYVYFDWNAMSGDANGKSLTKRQMINNVLKDVKLHNTSIVLMHDAAEKVKTVQMLPDLLDELLALDTSILPIDENTPLIQHVKAD